MSIIEGKVAFENLREHEVYNGQSTGKYTLTIQLEDNVASSLVEGGIRIKEYEGVPQRKFSSKFRVDVLKEDNTPYEGRIPRGSLVRLQYAEGDSHPQWGVSTYLNKVKVLKIAEDPQTAADDEDF